MTCTSASFCVAVGCFGLRHHLQRNQLVDAHRRRLDEGPRGSVLHQLDILRGGRQHRATRPRTTAPAGRRPLTSTRHARSRTVACTSSTFCVAVDASGYATTYNGTSWSTPTDIDSTRTIKAVACPARACAWRSTPRATPRLTTARPGRRPPTSTGPTPSKRSVCASRLVLRGQRQRRQRRHLQRQLVVERRRYRLALAASTPSRVRPTASAWPRTSPGTR